MVFEEVQADLEAEGALEEPAPFNKPTPAPVAPPAPAKSVMAAAVADDEMF